jgi:hypothetical protein
VALVCSGGRGRIVLSVQTRQVIDETFTGFAKSYGKDASVTTHGPRLLVCSLGAGNDAARHLTKQGAPPATQRVEQRRWQPL